MGKIIDISAGRISEAAVEIQRTEEFDADAQELSEVIRSLPLLHGDNDRLIFSILKQIGSAERGAFLQGFELGIKITKTENSIGPTD